MAKEVDSAILTNAVVENSPRWSRWTRTCFLEAWKLVLKGPKNNAVWRTLTAAGAASKWTSGRAVAMTLSSTVTHARWNEAAALVGSQNVGQWPWKTESIYSDKKDTITKKIRKSRESENEKHIHQKQTKHELLRKKWVVIFSDFAVLLQKFMFTRLLVNIWPRFLHVNIRVHNFLPYV